MDFVEQSARVEGKKKEEEKVLYLSSQVLEKNFHLVDGGACYKARSSIHSSGRICKSKREDFSRRLEDSAEHYYTRIRSMFRNNEEVSGVYEDEYSATFIIRYGIPSGTYLI